MMSLGRFASIGVVKGLGSVDVKKYAEKQAGSLAAAYSGMGAMSGNVKQWIMAALMATKTPMSWLPGLMTIAQHESGGNPNAINLWDSNAKAGIRHKGSCRQSQAPLMIIKHQVWVTLKTRFTTQLLRSATLKQIRVDQQCAGD